MNDQGPADKLPLRESGRASITPGASSIVRTPIMALAVALWFGWSLDIGMALQAWQIMVGSSVLCGLLYGLAGGSIPAQPIVLRQHLLLWAVIGLFVFMLFGLLMAGVGIDDLVDELRVASGFVAGCIGVVFFS